MSKRKKKEEKGKKEKITVTQVQVKSFVTLGRRAERREFVSMTKCIIAKLEKRLDVWIDRKGVNSEIDTIILFCMTRLDTMKELLDYFEDKDFKDNNVCCNEDENKVWLATSEKEDCP